MLVQTTKARLTKTNENVGQKYKFDYTESVQIWMANCKVGRYNVGNFEHQNDDVNDFSSTVADFESMISDGHDIL